MNILTTIFANNSVADVCDDQVFHSNEQVLDWKCECFEGSWQTVLALHRDRVSELRLILERRRVRRSHDIVPVGKQFY